MIPHSLQGVVGLVGSLPPRDGGKVFGSLVATLLVPTAQPPARRCAACGDLIGSARLSSARENTSPPVCWSCRSSASTVLELLQPVAGCCANETVLAMGQPVRIRIWTCSSRAAAALLRLHSNLQVCRASSHALPAMHGSHCNDRASCARAAGSCSVSSSTIRLAVCDRPHFGGALGERAELGVLSRPVESWQQPTGNGWPRAHGVGPLPGSSGDRPPMSVARMDSLVRSWCLA